MAHSTLYATYRSRLRPLRGAADLLRACKRSGLAVVLASSADKAEFDALRAALDAEDAIDATTYSGDVESGKPAPDLVEAALDKIGIPAGEAVFTGDTLGCASLQESRGAVHRLAERRRQQRRAHFGRSGRDYRGPGDLLAAFADSLLGTRHGRGGSDAAPLASADRAPRRRTV